MGKRSQILNYLCAKQQYDQWQMQREMHLKTQASSQEKHEKQVSNDPKTKQHKSIPDIPQFSIESQSRIISSQQQQQPQKQIPLLRKPDDTLFTVLPTMLHHPVPSEHNESIMQSQNNAKSKQQNQEEKSRCGIELSAHNLTTKEKSSSCATTTYPMPISSKKYHINDNRDLCRLPLKKKIKNRHLKDNECKSSKSSSTDYFSIDRDGNIKRTIARRASASAA